MPESEALLPPLTELRRRRRTLGLSQSELARAAGVSQSLVAKIERGRVDPSYRGAVALFTALDRHSAKSRPNLSVGALASHTVVRVRPSTLITVAAHTLRRHSISQLPVMEGDLVVGSLTDRTIVRCMSDPDRVRKLPRLTVAEVLDDPFPQLDKSAPVEMATGLLRYAPAVLVSEKGRIVAILTQSDLFKQL